MKMDKRLKIQMIGIICLLFMLANGLTAQTYGLTDREYDVVVVKGQKFQNLVGSEIDALRIYQYNIAQDVWTPVPFQIDELDGGSEFLAQGDGFLNPTDEIVFMTKDMGDQASTNNWSVPGLLPGSTRQELTFQDPLTGNQGWVYLYYAPELPLSDIRYVQIDTENDLVSSEFFTLQHGESGMLESVFLKTSAGGDSIDFIDRQKLRLKAKADFGVFGDKTFSLKEQMDENVSFVFTSVRFQTYKSYVTYLNNPVIRAHRSMFLHVKVHIPASDNFEIDLPFKSIYYPAFYELTIDKYAVPDLTFAGIDAKIKEVRLSTDLNENAVGMSFHNPHNTDGDIIVDGENDSYDKTYAWPGNNWHMFRAQPEYPNAPLTNASLLNLTMNAPPELGSSQELYYKDDNDYESADTGDKRKYGETGVLIKASNLAKDTLAFYEANYIVPQNLTIEESESIFNQHTNPLEVVIEQQRNVHTLAVNSTPIEGGIINALPNLGEIPSGETVTLEAVANPGYIFVRWSTSELDTNTTLSFIINQDTTITAVFEKRRGITITSVPLGLIVTIDEQPHQTPITFSWEPGDIHKICVNSIQSPVSKSTNIFQQWDTGDSYCDGFTMPATDTLLTALFQTQYLLEVSSNDFGSVQVSPGSIGGYYEEGTWVKLNAIPDPMYAFLNWSGDLQSNVILDSVLIDTSKIVNAVFGNLPPIVSAQDLVFSEDDTLVLETDSLRLWVEDTPSSLKPTVQLSSGKFITTDYDTITGNHYLINTAPNWNGQDTLTVTVTDPLGAVVQDTILVTVIPMPDPPSTFALASPITNTVLHNFPDSLLFTWNTASDVDLNDTLTYIFELDTTQAFNSNLHIQIAGIETNYLQLDWPETYGDKIYYWRVSVTDKTYVIPAETLDFVIALFTDVADIGQIPKTFMMDQNYPNPFNGTTEVRYGLPKQSDVKIHIYDNLGRLVNVLFNGQQKAGYHTVQWNGQNEQGQAVASGLYLFVLNTPDKRIVKKAMYIR